MLLITVSHGPAGRVLLSSAIAMLVAVAGCSKNPLAPLPADRASVPSTVTVGGKSFTVSVNAYRDTGPAFGTADRTLQLELTVESADHSAVPTDLKLDMTSASSGNDTWTTAIFRETPRSSSATRFVLLASGGPLWDVGTKISVIARLVGDNGKSGWVRAPDCSILPVL